jgi:hypothetical protein
MRSAMLIPGESCLVRISYDQQGIRPQVDIGWLKNRQAFLAFEVYDEELCVHFIGDRLVDRVLEHASTNLLAILIVKVSWLAASSQAERMSFTSRLSCKRASFIHSCAL